MSPQRGEAHDPATRQKIAESMTGKVETEEHRRHISESHRKRFIEQEKNNDYHLPKSRKCRVCGKKKSSDEFRLDRRKVKSGLIRLYLRSTCRQCESKTGKVRAKLWRDRNADKMPEKYRQYEANRSEESKDRQRQQRYENDTAKRRANAKGRGAYNKPVRGLDVKVSREPLVAFIKAEMERTGISVEKIAQRGGMNKHTAVSYVIQGWEPSKKNKTGRTSLQWISLHRVDQILTGLDQEHQLTILYTDEVIDAGIKAQSQEKAQKEERRRQRQKERRREKAKAQKERGQTSDSQKETESDA